MEVLNYVYYIVSILSVLLFVLSIQLKKKKTILLIQSASYICYSTVYAIKSAWSGLLTTIISIINNLVVLKKGSKVPLIYLALFIILITIISIIFYDGIFSLIPLFANIVIFVSTYFKNPKYIRYAVLISGILWGIYNFSNSAYILVLGNMLEIISAIVAIKRFTDVEIRRRKRKKLHMKNK